MFKKLSIEIMLMKSLVVGGAQGHLTKGNLDLVLVLKLAAEILCGCLEAQARSNIHQDSRSGLTILLLLKTPAVVDIKN